MVSRPLLIALILVSTAAGGAPAAIPPPQIPDKVFKITDFGAVADGKTKCTDAIVKAIAACKDAGGGVVLVPAGRYLTGPFALASNMNLRIEKDATLLISNDPSDFKLTGGSYENCITARSGHDIAISGEGTIDGQGQPWWDSFRKFKNAATTTTTTMPTTVPAPPHRPYLVVIKDCQRVRVENVTLTNSPMFHLVTDRCRDVTIDGVKFFAPQDAPNTDALDPSGWNYHITRCIFDTGDDCIAFKASGAPEKDRFSCEDFLVTDCTFRHGHGLSIGGQTSGGMRRLTVRDCTFENTDAGIRMKAPRGNGGVVEELSYENIRMKNVKVAIFITSFYPKIPDDVLNDPPQPMTPRTPVWRRIRISNITAEGGEFAGHILGLAEMPVEDVVMTNVNLSAKVGMDIVHARGIQFVNSRITAEQGPPLVVKDAQVTGLEPSDSNR